MNTNRWMVEIEYVGTPGIFIHYLYLEDILQDKAIPSDKVNTDEAFALLSDIKSLTSGNPSVARVKVTEDRLAGSTLYEYP